MLTLDVYSLSIRLFDEYLHHMLVKFEQNRMVRTIQNFKLFDKKMDNHFCKSVDPIFSDFGRRFCS